MSKVNKARWITWALMLLLIGISIYTIYILLENREMFRKDIKSYIKQEVSAEIQKIPVPKDGTNGYTPIKGVDYFDGKDGKDGKDSVSTHTVEREVIVREAPAAPSPMPEFRCNVAKNRWEMRYTGDESWKVLNDEPVPCTINADILTQLYLNLRKE